MVVAIILGFIDKGWWIWLELVILKTLIELLPDSRQGALKVKKDE